MEQVITRFIHLRPANPLSEKQTLNLTDIPYLEDKVKQALESQDYETLAGLCKKFGEKAEKIYETLPKKYLDVIHQLKSALRDNKTSLKTSEFWEKPPDPTEFASIIQSLVILLICERLGKKTGRREELEEALTLLLTSKHPETYAPPFCLVYPNIEVPRKTSSKTSEPSDEDGAESRKQAEHYNDIQHALTELESVFESERQKQIYNQDIYQKQIDRIYSPQNRVLKKQEILAQFSGQEAKIGEKELERASNFILDQHIEQEMLDLDDQLQIVDPAELDVSKLSKRTINTINNFGIQSPNLYTITSQLNQHAGQIGHQLARTNPHMTFKTASTGFGVSWAIQFPQLKFPLRLKSEVDILGLADLIVLKEDVIRYEAKEISHIENILAGEHKERRHERRRYSETIDEEKTESETVQITELMTTERNELKAATKLQIEAEFGNETYANGSGSYGPVASFEAGTKLNASGSSAFAAETNQEFSREIISRAVEEIKESTTRTVRSKLISEFSETNTHGVDNTKAGAKNIAGIYQYLEKVLCVKQYNYGSRLMLSAMIAEPSDNLIAFTRKDRERVLADLEEPPKFDIKVEDLHHDTYNEEISRFKAAGVKSLPDKHITVTKTITFDDSNLLAEGMLDDAAEKFVDLLSLTYERGARWAEAGAIEIPDGYEALSARVITIHPINISESVLSFDEDAWLFFNTTDSNTVSKYYPAASHVSWTVGNRSTRHRYNLGTDGSPRDRSRWDFEKPIRGDLPYAFSVWAISSGLSVTITVRCRRTWNALQNWRHETYEKLYASYLRLLSVYEEKLSLLNFSDDRSGNGNPRLNRITERREIKQKVIDAILIKAGVELTQENYSEITKLFELAIEWENINYKLFSDSYSEKESTLRALKMLSQNDSRHNDFLRAKGALVLVPVRVEYAANMTSFIRDGNLDGFLARENDVALITDLINSGASPDNQKPLGTPFEVSIPTSLIYLKPDGELPILGECK